MVISYCLWYLLCFVFVGVTFVSVSFSCRNFALVLEPLLYEFLYYGFKCVSHHLELNHRLS